MRQAKWWVKQVKQECDPGVVIALVGNKLDLAESHRDVPTEVLFVIGLMTRGFFFFFINIPYLLLLAGSGQIC